MTLTNLINSCYKMGNEALENNKTPVGGKEKRDGNNPSQEVCIRLLISIKKKGKNLCFGSLFYFDSKGPLSSTVCLFAMNLIIPVMQQDDLEGIYTCPLEL